MLEGLLELPKFNHKNMLSLQSLRDFWNSLNSIPKIGKVFNRSESFYFPKFNSSKNMLCLVKKKERLFHSGLKFGTLKKKERLFYFWFEIRDSEEKGEIIPFWFEIRDSEEKGEIIHFWFEIRHSEEKGETIHFWFNKFEPEKIGN